jgi:acylphosphatase
MMAERLHASIAGQVQGVGFRAYVFEQALVLEITGWVRNRWDGTVEVVAEGERLVLEQFLGLLRRGPRGAYVSDLHFEWLEAQDEFRDFRVRRTE